ncbi:MAG: phage tail sheath subtilisin-like domain-containing protein [Rubrivivax sp.]
MASPNISFDNIPASIRKPGKYVEFNSKLAVRTLPSNVQRLLIVAQKLAAGTAPAGVPVDVFDAATAAALFGRGSQAHLMVKATIEAYRYARITVLPLADSGTGVAATWTITFTGTSTASGSVTVTLAGDAVNVPIATAQTAAQVAASVKLELDKEVDWPVTVTAAAGVLTLTAKNKGTVANGLVLATDAQLSGITAAAATGVAGSNDPDLAAALTAVFAVSHEILVTPYNTAAALQTLRTHLTDRGSPIEQRGAIGVYAFTGTLAAATTLAAAVNHERITGCLLPGTASPAYDLAARYAAVISSEEDPARPLNTLALTGAQPPALASRLGRTEQESCLANGVTPLEVGPGEVVQIVRAITTYTVNAQAIPDIALLDLTTIRTMDYVRQAQRTRLALRFPREKLSQRTPDRVRSEVLDVLVKLEELEIVEAVEENKAGVIVERDSQDPNRLDVRIPVDVVNGLHVLAARLDLLL